MSWRYTLNLTPEYQETKDKKHTIYELSQVIVGRTRLLPIRCIDWNLIADEFEFIGTDATDEDFNVVMGELYDYADANRIWIATS